jgi:hypothetical protein
MRQRVYQRCIPPHRVDVNAMRMVTGARPDYVA